jgi:hypothetical protein
VTRAINWRLFRRTNNNSITNVRYRFADMTTSWCNTPHTATTEYVCHLHFSWFHIACLLHHAAQPHHSTSHSMYMPSKRS